MSMIFIGGSREIFELPDPAITRIGAIVAAEHGVLIGDASGADAEAQGLLAGYKYEHVGVFHAGKEPRNNLGDWAAYHVPSPDDATANKPCVIYDLARGSVATTYNVEDWCAMLRHARPDSRRQAEARMTPDERMVLPG